MTHEEKRAPEDRESAVDVIHDALPRMGPDEAAAVADLLPSMVPVAATEWTTAYSGWSSAATTDDLVKTAFVLAWKVAAAQRLLREGRTPPRKRSRTERGLTCDPSYIISVYARSLPHSVTTNHRRRPRSSGVIGAERVGLVGIATTRWGPSIHSPPSHLPLPRLAGSGSGSGRG